MVTVMKQKRELSLLQLDNLRNEQARRIWADGWKQEKERKEGGWQTAIGRQGWGERKTDHDGLSGC
jgi:hypothetical protein